MLDFWTGTSLITAISVMDYYNDKARMERERLHDYAICMDQLGENIQMIGTSILSLLKKSDCYDLEKEIIQGAFQLPLYIFKRVMHVQRNSLSKYQRKMIDIYFSTIKESGVDKTQYMKSLTDPRGEKDMLDHNIGLTTTYCGVFWNRLLEILYRVDDVNHEMDTLIRNYADALARYAMLGDCNPYAVQTIFQEFSSGLARHLQTLIETAESKSANPLSSEIKNADCFLEKMRRNCEYVVDKGTEEDKIVVELFDYFAISMVIGFLEHARVGQNRRKAILQFVMDSLVLSCDETASEIYKGMQVSPGMKQVFYEFANEWREANFWKIHQIASSRSNIPEATIEFTESAVNYLKAVERLIQIQFPDINVCGQADSYMKNVVRKMTDLMRP